MTPDEESQHQLNRILAREWAVKKFCDFQYLHHSHLSRKEVADIEASIDFRAIREQALARIQAPWVPMSQADMWEDQFNGD